MGFDWEDAAEGGEESEKVPAGWHQLKVLKIVTSKNSGDPFTSKKGDPQILLIFGDRHGRECSQMYTLSEAAAWTLAKLVSRMGFDLAKLKQQGVEPAHFARTQIAESWLKGNYTYAHVSWSEPNEQGRCFSEVNPLHWDEMPESEQTRLQAEQQGQQPQQQQQQQQQQPAPQGDGWQNDGTPLGHKDSDMEADPF